MPTMREVPADAVVISHQLMLRAGLIRKAAAGIYTYLPLGLRVIKKISHILEEEMDKIGSQQILMPMVQSSDLWRESGRFNEYGPELLRFQDRKESWFCLGPTHEEMVTSLVRDNIKSYKTLPLILYQIQAKFRDEIRPRFGLMRGREFIMKDAYSFCIDKESQDIIYKNMWDAYHRIFNRCGLLFKAVRAATGSIGGNLSHEFQVLAQSGEDAIASCDACGFAANVELAPIKSKDFLGTELSITKAREEISTPAVASIDALSSFLKISAEKIIKSLAFVADGQLILALVRGDHQVSEAKLKSALKAQNLILADDGLIAQKLGTVGFIGPLDTKNIKIIADQSLRNLGDMICGANKKDAHYKNIQVGRDFDADYLDIKEANDGDACGECGAAFKILRGIEVGHIFYLGTKYSQAMGAVIQNQSGENTTLEMGCYGIGVGRTAAAAIEQNHDDKGIIWPLSLAPYQVHIVQLGVEPELNELSKQVYTNLEKANIEVLLDDRDERAGVKLNDADLLGCPLRITIGKRSAKNNEIEVLPRNKQDQGALLISLGSDYVTTVKELLANYDNRRV
jgi:prolyl-tRNA synthetase